MKESKVELKERRKRANGTYVGYLLFAMAHTTTKRPSCKTIEQMKTHRVTEVPRATTARSRSNQFVW